MLFFLFHEMAILNSCEKFFIHFQFGLENMTLLMEWSSTPEAELITTK